jgi:uncharacterized phage-associated protein
MIPYQKEKIDNAICFFAKMHKSKTKHYLYQTFLYKYLAFFEFNMLEKTGQPSLGLTFFAFPRGPVPKDIYENRKNIDNDLYRFKDVENNQYVIIAKKDPDLEYFSKDEIHEMNVLIEIYAKSYISSNLISDASHEKIKAWRKTWKSKPNKSIDISLTFDDNLFHKKDNELSFSEENYLLYNALTNKLNDRRECNKME